MMNDETKACKSSYSYYNEICYMKFLPIVVGIVIGSLVRINNFHQNQAADQTTLKPKFLNCNSSYKFIIYLIVHKIFNVS